VAGGTDKSNLGRAQSEMSRRIAADSATLQNSADTESQTPFYWRDKGWTRELTFFTLSASVEDWKKI
jgi:hypothetical protein